jgi:organic radical activating enzyme
MGPTDRRLLALRDGVVRHGPQTLHIDVTNTCNTNCVTCWDHSPHLTTARSSAWKRQRVDVDAVVALLDDVQSLDTDEARLQHVILSGMGEPFTHPDIYALIADVKRRDLHLTIITNLVAADVDRVVALGVDALLVGVQGASAASYLAFHPNFNASHWALVNQQLDRLADEPHIDVKQVQVVCAHNAHELVAMVELAHRTAAAQVNFKLASLKAGTEAVRITPAQRAQLLTSGIDEAVARAAALGMKTNLAVFRAQVAAGVDSADDADGEAGSTADVGATGCFLGHFYARVTVDGTVLYCCNTDVVIGSLQTLPFSQWWRSARWEHWRRRMREGRYLESCAQCGKWNQNVALSARFRARFGDDAFRAVTQAPSTTTRARPARPPPQNKRASLRVLP